MAMERSFDFLFAGAGILGSSAAYALSMELERRGERASIGVIDLDLEGEHSSTLKNAGGVRATWRSRANIELCKYSIDFYETISEVIQFREFGYYWMHDSASWKEVNENHPLYVEYGLPVELHRPEDLKRIIPLVTNTEGVAGLSISRKAGLIDHYSLREYYRGSAKARGVKFISGFFINGVKVEGGRAAAVTAYDLGGLGKGQGGYGDAAREILTKGAPDKDLPVAEFKCGTLINTAGAWAPVVSRLYGFEDDAIKPRRRQMVVIDAPDVDLSEYGMVIDTSDVYFHQEGTGILAGYSNMDEPAGYNFDFSFGGMSEESRFVKYIWEPLYSRMNGFEKVRLVRGWAGIYAETPDRSGYLGKVPGYGNIYECAGHTGRGLMISYGAGVALTDIILDGKPRRELKHASDLSRERKSGPLYEGLHL
ncbi:MAG: NAD(P)/FAD-dependent oxidoreductase [Candidatus Dadabacteria bacterium]